MTTVVPLGETNRAASAAPTIASARKVELVEGVEAEHARAVNGRADEVVFLEDANVEAGRGQLARRDES